MNKLPLLFLSWSILFLHCPTDYSFSQTLKDTLQAQRDYTTAQQFLKVLKYDSALIYLNQSYEAYKSHQCWERIADIASEIIETHRTVARYDLALTKGYMALEQIKQNLGSDNLSYAKVLSAITITLWSKGDLDSSLEANRSVLQIRIAKLGYDHFDVAAIYNMIGIIYSDKSKFDSALFYSKEALRIRISTSGPFHNSVASSYINIGVIYRRLGDYTSAEEYYKKALTIRIKTLGDEHPRTALIYDNLGICYDIMGDVEKSADYHAKALSSRIRAFGTNHPDVAGSYVDLAILNYNRQNYRSALDYQSRALQVRQNIFGINSIAAAASLGNIGNIYRELGDNDSALFYYDSAFAVNKKKYKIHGEVAKNMTYLAIIHGKRKEFFLSDSLFSAAIEMANKAFGSKNPEIAEMWMHRAEIAEQNNNVEVALRYTQNALITQLPAFSDSSISENPPLQLIRPETGTIVILAQKARLLKKQYDRTKKLLYLEESYNVYNLTASWIDILRQGYRLEGSKIFLGSKAKIIYESALKTISEAYYITSDNKWIDRAFVMSQRSKAGTLREALHELQVRNFATISDSILRLERELKTQIAFYETKYTPSPQSSKFNNSDEQSYTAKILFDLKSRYETLQQSIEKTNPAYYQLKYDITVPNISDIQNHLKIRPGVVLDYFVGDSLIMIIRLTDKTKTMIAQSKDSTFEYTIRHIRQGLTDLDISSYERYSIAFYNQWVKPSLESIAIGTPLIIIPDGMLYYLPFETLLMKAKLTEGDKQNTRARYLSEDYSIQYLMSADMLLSSHSTIAPNSFYGIAPVFDDSVTSGDIQSYKFYDSTKTSSRQIQQKGEGFPTLPYSIQEVKQIKSLFSQRKLDSKIIVHRAATKKQVLNDTLIHYGYIHVASHGFINEVNPKLSGIALYSDDSVDVKEDILYAGEIYNLRLKAHLVTLSACKTALGKIEKGEGVIGLTRGFIYAGARHVLVSLWPVDDRLTAEFMTEFYRNVFTEKNLSLALQKTQKRWIAQQHTSYPGDWGAFVLIGY
ncbi:CHAT domain-containing protein [bacterium]|nr:CHAT domain-containing protein [bacterium]NUN45821.1 CHAT domain-containing protein [bacterium]